MSQVFIAVHVPTEKNVHTEREFVWVRRAEKRKSIFERNIITHNITSEGISVGFDTCATAFNN